MLLPFFLSLATSCGMSCIIGVAVGVVVLVILACLVIIVIAVKCHHKGMFSVLDLYSYTKKLSVQSK